MAINSHAIAGFEDMTMPRTNLTDKQIGVLADVENFLRILAESNHAGKRTAADLADDLSAILHGKMA